MNTEKETLNEDISMVTKLMCKIRYVRNTSAKLLIEKKFKQKQESNLTGVLIRVYVKPQFLEIIFSIEN